MKNEEDVIVVTKPIKIEEGKHEGIITNVLHNLPNEAEGRTYDYLDVVIKITDSDNVEVKTGFPANISELSTLGRLLKKAGMDIEKLEEGEKVSVTDIKEKLVDREITFLSKNEKTSNGEFARVLKDTIEFS